MSTDALLWICTLLFAAAMLILSAMRHAEAAGAADEADPDEDETRQAYRPASRGLDLGGGWTVGGSGRDD
jgi:ABC-type cobalt transport system substrate-binding protein